MEVDINENIRQHENIAENENPIMPCGRYGRRFRTNRGVLQLLQFCIVAEIDQTGNNELERPKPAEEQLGNDDATVASTPGNLESFYWRSIRGIIAKNNIKSCYEKVVLWRRNLFLLAKGTAVKNYIREITKLLNAWIDDTPLRKCAMHEIHIMPSLLLHKPFNSSKSKDHVNARLRP